MRLDANNGDRDWPCYDARHCCMVPYVLWVDDATATWGQLVKRMGPPFLEEVVRKENRITIYQSRRLVVFNEIDGVNDEQDGVADVIHRPSEVTA
jgi:hypothetical protein